jgi:hypothetical protein
MWSKDLALHWRTQKRKYTNTQQKHRRTYTGTFVENTRKNKETKKQGRSSKYTETKNIANAALWGPRVGPVNPDRRTYRGSLRTSLHLQSGEEADRRRTMEQGPHPGDDLGTLCGRWLREAADTSWVGPKGRLRGLRRGARGASESQTAAEAHPSLHGRAPGKNPAARAAPRQDVHFQGRAPTLRTGSSGGRPPMPP